LLPLLAIPKGFAGPLSPFLALIGLKGVLLAFWRRDWLALAAGLSGVFFATQHIKKVTAPHDEFAFVFGADWQQRIPPHLQWRLRSKRYEVRPLTSPLATISENVIIGCHQETGEPLLADVWQPPAGIPHTGIGIIYLHGSGWHYMDKDFQGTTRPLFHYLANQGHVIADVAYTLAPKATIIPMVADVKRAIAWMKTNAVDLGINPERIVLMGGSAGAHLALLAAYSPNHPILDPADVSGLDTAVHGVISYYGISDAVSGHERLTHIPPTPTVLSPWVERLLKRGGMLLGDGRYVEARHMIPLTLGGLPHEEPDMYQLASPLTHVGPHCPPTLLINGTHDIGPDINQHRQLHAALYRQGVPCVHVEIECADHAFDLIAPRWSPAAQAALYDVERFLGLLV
ncbi:MAG TPA: alpha/beta hydrolase, partial [Chloroflexota bacterium]|nr:alpha/beta hydrolase [Chloroflexota bacterium]